MTYQQTKIEEHLEKFRKELYSTRVNVQQDSMTYGYSTPHLAASACCDANETIAKFKLPLVAMYNSGTSTFTVKSNEIADI